VTTSFKEHFSRFLGSDPTRLHLAAHSHHPWPDVTFDAHERAWNDAAQHHDHKWDRILHDLWPSAQRHVARQLNLPDPSTVVFAPNTHEFVVRLLSCFEAPVRILTTDAEFHSFRRQVDRLAEEGLVELERVAARPHGTFADRLASAARNGSHDLVFFSQVQFDSGAVVSDLANVVRAVPADTPVVVDGYHAFMALPVDLSAIADRIFWLGGGYKYAMAGEGAAFLHCPPGWLPRPRATGWYGEFGDLTAPPGGVGYRTDAQRFMGATFDPSGLYRFVSVQDWLVNLGVDVAAIHRRVQRLQLRFMEQVMDANVLPIEAMVPGLDEVDDRGNFLAFAVANAPALDAALAARHVVVDHRGDRLRFGFGLYHDDQDVEVAVARLGDAVGAAAG